MLNKEKAKNMFFNSEKAFFLYIFFIYYIFIHKYL